MSDWQIICGDALEELRKMPDDSVACVVTSPPYNLVRDYIRGGPNTTMDAMRKKILDEWYEDEMPEEEYQAWQRECIAEMLRVCSGVVFYNHKIRYAIKRRGRALHPTEWVPMGKLWCEIIWDRGGGLPGKVSRFIHSDERIFMLGRPNKWRPGSETTVWRIAPRPGNTGHPCSFPVELPARCIKACTDEGDLVLDPFSGAATTGVAALETNRRFLGIELNPDYVKMAEKRLKNTMPLFQGKEK